MYHAVDPCMSSRREFLRKSGCGFGSLALSALLAEQAAAAATRENPLAPRSPHFSPRAKRVIFLWMQGGPSQADLFDSKPRLEKEAGEKIPFELSDTPGRVKERARLFGPVSRLNRVGQSGMWMTEWLPHLATKVDELCFLRGMQSDSPAHPGAIRLMQTGSVQFVRPSMGSWILYGLGTENQNLPGFVVISPVLFGDDGSPLHYSNVFLPTVYQGTRIGMSTVPIKDSKIGYLSDPSISPDLQKQHLDFIQMRNRRHLEEHGADRDMEGLIQSYELAFRMQMEAPTVFNVSSESKVTRDLYGIDDKATDNFGRKCLMARRLIEAGVRFVQVTDGGWDHHARIRSTLRDSCERIDKPITGLLTDLKARGLLDDTLVVWTGEFGRTPYDQDDSKGKGGLDARGRDHNPHCWTMWMAGAGVKQGVVHGETDEYAWKAVDGKVHVHDLHATILHLLGLNHEKLTYRYSGRDFRLTDVYGRVVEEILA
jgi:Protein of unknown function (DUF1501)